MSSDENNLYEKVQELESLVAAKDADLAHYRAELTVANQKLESLMANISRDLKALTRLQKKLVPTEFPHIKGFEFSSKFIPSAVSGGDYLDIFEHSDQLKFSLVMTSASGYGMSALLLSSVIGLGGIVSENPELSSNKILTKVFDEVDPMAPNEEAAEVFYAVINRRTLAMDYTLMGDVYVFVQRHSNGDLEHLEPTGPTYKKEHGYSSLKSATVKLKPKDRIVVCSRGIVQAENLEDEIFSVERLIKVIMGASQPGVHELRNEILFKVQQFCQGAQPPRDQSVIVTEVKEGTLSLA